MRVRNISKIVKSYMKIHRKHIGKTIVVHNLQCWFTCMSIVRLICKKTTSFTLY